MLKLLGGTFVVLVGVAMLLGIGVLVVHTVVYVTPAFRRVRFADREIRMATPILLRWFGIAPGRRLRPRSPQRRAGSRSNYFKMLAVGLLIVIAPLVGVTVMAFAVAPGGNDSRNLWLELAIMFGGAVVSGYALLRLSRTFRRLRRERQRLRAATAAEARATDPRAPIVLLRAFRDDGQQVALLDEQGLPVTLEEVLVERLARHGPVIAVGSPGERLPPIGASREYVSGDWRARVTQLIDNAGVIVVLLDRTPGLLWEIRQVVTRRREERLLIIVPDEATVELEERWRALRRIIESCRPELDDDGLSIALDGTLAVVFDSDHRAHRILARDRSRPYYRDAVENAMWFVAQAYPQDRTRMGRSVL
jgi:threonine/homoserine/homoserine lactone efflux protein